MQRDLSAFAPLEAPALPPDAVLDADGLVIPEPWCYGHKGRENWGAQTLAWRARRSAEYLAKLAEPPKAPRERRPGATRFTTQYAVDWGKARGWKLVAREGYDHRTRRHHDLELGVDVIFDDGLFGRVGVQGAGVGERAEHYRRFEERGGVETAHRRALRVIYLEFVRGRKAPVKEEQWA